MPEEHKIFRKIEIGRKYRIWRKDYNGKTFYNIQVSQKQYPDGVEKYYIPITFRKGVSVDNETDIIIYSGIENLRSNKNVEDKKKPYCPIFSYMIEDFEIVERQEQIEKNAFDEFRENLEDNEVVIDDNFLD